MLGCGGSGGGSSSGGGTTANPYAGAYSGDFIDQSDTIAAFTMTISSSGAISGQLGYGTPIAFTGSVNSAGAGSITDSNGTFQVTLGTSGQPVLGGGVGTPTNGIFITAVTNPTGVYSGLSGGYVGTVHNTTLGATGIISVVISSSGSVVGVDLFDVNGTPTLVPLTGTLSSNGTLSYTVHGVTVSGTLAQSGTTLSGSLSESNGDSASITLGQVQPVP